MGFPNSIRAGALISGFPGEISHDGPTRAIPVVLGTATESNNVFGRVVTISDDATETYVVGGEGAIVGILIHPKAYAIDADYARNGTQQEALIEGNVYVQLDGAQGKQGDAVFYDKATGAITVTESADTLPIPGAYVDRHLPSADTAHLAVIYLPGHAAVAP